MNALGPGTLIMAACKIERQLARILCCNLHSKVQSLSLLHLGSVPVLVRLLSCSARFRSRLNTRPEYTCFSIPVIPNLGSS